MKLLRHFAYATVSLFLVTSCSNDEVQSLKENPDALGRDGVFMSLILNPTGVTGTRSYTSGDNASNDGVEVGTDDENKIRTALIVLTDRANKYIASSMISGTDNNSSITGGTVGGTTLYQAIAKFDKSTIADYYTGGGNGEINVFVFCNPTSDLKTKIENTNTESTDWTEYICENPSTLWDAENGFMMSNVSIAQRNLPKNISEWINYNTPLKAFDLSGVNAPGTEGVVDNFNSGRGNINVRRLAARLDFRDGSQVEGVGNGIKDEPFTYAVVNNVKKENIVKCQILSMALTNMSKTQYYLSRVSDNGRPAGGNYMLCGPEKTWFNNASGNYVISTNHEAKTNIIQSGFSNYFEYPFFDAQGYVQEKGDGWDWISCETVIGRESDNYVNDVYNKSFHVWRYLTENTIPRPRGSEPTQVNSQSTGVVFKAHLLPTSILTDEGSDVWERKLYDALDYNEANVGDGKLLHKNPDTDPIIYSLSGNSLYITWENVQAAALAEAGYDVNKGANQTLDRNTTLYRLVYGTGGVGTVGSYKDSEALDQASPNYKWTVWQANANSVKNVELKSNFKKAATGAGFTLYQSSEDPTTHKWGYYCYYYYWNRHNDNNQEGVMGPMEFAVVHNNVYKLTVTRLNTLGHPRIPENDPDDPKPDTPDEKSEIYMTVTVDVIPWVVRINNIEF